MCSRNVVFLEKRDKQDLKNLKLLSQLNWNHWDFQKTLFLLPKLMQRSLMNSAHVEEHRVHNFISHSHHSLWCCSLFPCKFGEANHSNDSSAKVTERHSKGESQVTPNLSEQTKQGISEHLPRHRDGLAKDESDRLVGAGRALLFAGQHPRHPHCGACRCAGVQSWKLGPPN